MTLKNNLKKIIVKYRKIQNRKIKVILQIKKQWKNLKNILKKNKEKVCKILKNKINNRTKVKKSINCLTNNLLLMQKMFLIKDLYKPNLNKNNVIVNNNDMKI